MEVAFVAKMFKRSKVAIAVSDMGKAIKFYTKVLGLKLDERYDEWAEIKGPGVTLGLYPGKRGKKSSEDISIGFEVNDLDKTVDALEGKGVKFEIVDEDYMKFAYFTDPDGTELYLAEEKP